MNNKKKTRQDAKEWIVAHTRLNKDGCWIWTGPIGKNNGPIQKRSIHRAKIGGWNVDKYQMISNQASRSAYALWFPNKFNPELLVLHGSICNPNTSGMCVNPFHMHQGTLSDNSNEAYQYGNRASGEEHSNSVLTKKQVLKIRKLAATGLNRAQIARKVGFDIPRWIDDPTGYRKVINLIESAKKHWKHI